MVSFRDLFQRKLTKTKILLKEDNVEALFTLSLALMEAVKKVFRRKGGFRFSEDPVIERKPIAQFKRRMRIDAMEKFNKPTVFSVIHFYQEIQNNPTGSPIGVLIIYAEVKYLPEILRLLKYPYIEYDDEEAVKDGCGALCNLIAGYFRNEILQLDYKELDMSSFKSYVNADVEGIDFCWKEPEKYELNFTIDGQKRLVAEMVMGPLQKL